MNRRSIASIVALMALGAVGVTVMRSERPREVHAATTAYRLLSSTVQGSGTLVLEEDVKLVPEVPGRVLEILVKPGDRVQQGQLLIRLDASPHYAELAQLKAAAGEAQAAIKQATMEVEIARRGMSRFDGLAARGLIEPHEYEKADSKSARAREELGTRFAALDRVNAGIVEAERRLAKTDLRAPISGIVTALFIGVGDTVGPAGTSAAGLLAIAGPGSLYADVSVDERAMARVRVGQAAKIVVTGFPDRILEGRVSAVSRSGRFPVRIDLGATAAESFSPGLSCQAEIAAPADTLRRLRDASPMTIAPPGTVSGSVRD